MLALSFYCGFIFGLLAFYSYEARELYKLRRAYERSLERGK
jgi:hypothetical protein